MLVQSQQAKTINVEQSEDDQRFGPDNRIGQPSAMLLKGQKSCFDGDKTTLSSAPQNSLPPPPEYSKKTDRQPIRMFHQWLGSKYYNIY